MSHARIRAHRRPAPILAAALLCSLLAAAPAGAAVRVALVPTSAWPERGAQVAFNADVTGTTNLAVTWRVNDVPGGSAATGTITPGGVYTAPAAIPSPPWVDVSAVSQADGTRIARAIVYVTAPQVALSISPVSAAAAPGATTQFTATVGNADSQAATWSVNGIRGGNAAVGTIDADGTYTAPAVTPAPVVVVVSAVARASAAATDHASVLLGGPADWFVATGGSDANAGTSPLAPFRTLARAAQAARAGESVQVAGGVYAELLALPRSGSAGDGYIHFHSAPGETAVLDAGGLPFPPGESDFGVVTIHDRSWLVVSGFEIRNFSSRTSAVPMGIYVGGAGSDLHLLDNHVHDIVTTGPAGNHNALGIAVYAVRAPQPIRDLVIRGNEVYNLTSGSSESVVIGGNAIRWTIADNRVHDNNNIGIDAVGHYDWMSPDPELNYARNGTIARNVVYNITSYRNPAYGPDRAAGGIYVDGGADIVIEGNVVHHADLGLELAAEVPGANTHHVIARSNLLYANLVTGISIGGYEAGVGGTRSCTLVNNTLHGNDTHRTGTGEFQIQFNAALNVFRNNIVSAGPQGRFVNSFVAADEAPALLDDNLYFTEAGASAGRWTWRGDAFAGYAAWRAGTGLDAASHFGNPLYVDSALPVLRLRAASPAINAGVDLGVAVRGRKDAALSGRRKGPQIDVGAYERP